ncbi:hypothetical protein MYX84_10190 [Acidobacteria bacterium AH-259-O06]|nr:hypothetical protein [Acidobacteria bacterium AH-259-O06]
MRINQIVTRGAAFLLFGVAAFGQIIISSTPVAVIATGQAELLAKLRLTAGASGAVADTLTIRYDGLPLMNDQTTGISLNTSGWSASITSVDKANGVITISAPAGAAGNFFEVQGVRMSFEGLNVSNVKAAVTSLVNLLIVGGLIQNEVTVVNSVAQGMTVDPASDTVFIVQSPELISPSASLRIREGFESAFTDAVGSFGQTTATRVRIRVQALPSGSSLTFAATVTETNTGATLTVLSGSELTLPTSTGETTITYAFTAGASSSASTESFDVRYDLAIATAPLEPVAVSLQASLFPSEAPSIPRFVTRDLPLDEELALPEFLRFIPVFLTADGFLGVAFTNQAGVENTVELQLFAPNGQLLSGTGIVNPTVLTVPSGSQRSAVVEEIFGSAIRGADLGTILARTRRARAASLFLVGDNANTLLDGATGVQTALKNFILPSVARDGASPFTSIHIFNPSADSSVELELKLRDLSGTTVASRNLSLPARGTLSEELSTLLGVDLTLFSGGYVEGVAAGEVVAFEFFGNVDSLNALNGQPAALRRQSYWIPHFAVGGGFDTEFNFINAEVEKDAILELTAFDDQGALLSAALNPVQISLQPGEQKILSAASLFGLSPAGQQIVGSIRMDVRGSFGGPFASVPGLNGSIGFKSQDGRLSASLPLLLTLQLRTLYPHVAQNLGFFTGVAVLNPNLIPIPVTVEVFDREGVEVGSNAFTLPPGGRRARLLNELVPPTAGQIGGYFRVRSDVAVVSFALFGDLAGQSISAIPSQ